MFNCAGLLERLPAHRQRADDHFHPLASLVTSSLEASQSGKGVL